MDEPVPAGVPDGEAEVEGVAAWLDELKHARPDEWLKARFPGRSRVAFARVWRELLRDECDKLENQAFCALDQIRSAEDPEDVLMLAVDDLPRSVEQAFSIAPSLAAPHLALLKDHSEERHARFLMEMDAGGPGEAAERAECLSFWEENAEDLSDLRRSLFRLVREGIEKGPGSS